VEGADYDELIADQTTQQEYETGLNSAMIQTIKRSNPTTTLSSSNIQWSHRRGSVISDATITPPDGETAGTIETSLTDADTTTFVAEVVQEIESSMGPARLARLKGNRTLSASRGRIQTRQRGKDSTPGSTPVVDSTPKTYPWSFGASVMATLFIWPVAAGRF